MKDKLEAGMYVRTNDGYIGKLIGIREDNVYSHIYEFDNDIWDTSYADSYYDSTELFEDEMHNLTIKPSFDIMDIIQEGDFVNGQLVKQVGYNHLDEFVIKVQGVFETEFYIQPNEIKSILTKELYEVNSYEFYRKGE